MGSVTVKSVSNKKELNDFIKFPFLVYKNYKYWVPPLNMEQKNLLNKEKNPFFKDAEAEYFLAERDGKIVGRISAIKNNQHLKNHNDASGHFGFFECIDDQEVANALFNKAKEWIKENGLKYMKGPAN
ncbi:MAG: hypothetical protein HKM87_08875, partial [Ignavibacteriaceae bacterium]|nr:hypothetical protein [Ignavibacteriaceae bacterium]